MAVLRISDFAVHAPNNFGDVFFVVADEFADFRIGPIYILLLVVANDEIVSVLFDEHFKPTNSTVVTPNEINSDCKC